MENTAANMIEEGVMGLTDFITRKKELEKGARCTLYCTSAVQWKMGTRFNYKCIGFQEMCFERSIQTCLDLKYTQNDLSNVDPSHCHFSTFGKNKMAVTPIEM